MKNKFTITISDINGSKHYLLHQIIKRFVLYFTLFVVLLIVGGSFFISFLMNEVETLEKKKEVALKEQQVLEKENNKLLSQIEVKTKEFDTLKDKISDIEELVGISDTSDYKVDVRLENLKFTSAQQKVFFENIPNGEVVPYKGYSGKFGWRVHPILKRKEFHRGLDLRADMNTPVRAPADGVIEYAGYHKSSGFGNLVIIDHNFGFKTSYGHLSKKFPFKAGDYVKKGDIIAYTGSSGLSTGPHLHYEVRFIGRPLNPIYFVKWNSANFEDIFKKEKRVSWQSLINLMEIRHQLLKQQ
ncbi:peptidoglycan DD-metalloendopeptidase family protein [Sulfurospirillum sp. 1307]|jgi:murein DD-endopeptidase MepM/ murein hydrolase activator NlpD